MLFGAKGSPSPGNILYLLVLVFVRYGGCHLFFFFVPQDSRTSQRFTTNNEQLTKRESLEKLRLRLGACKTGLKPPVFFTDRSKAIILLWS